jgi:DNA-binding FadR family transcriptional regulator
MICKISRAIKRHENSRYDLRASIEAVLSFHEAIFDAAGNRACSRILSLIHRSVWRALSVTSQNSSSPNAHWPVTKQYTLQFIDETHRKRGS